MATDSLKLWLKQSPLYRADRFMHMVRTPSGGFTAHIEDPKGFDKWRSDTTTFDNLPREIRILILSFLPPEALFKLAGVSRSWYDITNDPLLWRHVLLKELPLWPTVTSSTFPNHHDLFKRPKHTYRHCSPLMGEKRLELSLLQGARGGNMLPPSSSSSLPSPSPSSSLTSSSLAGSSSPAIIRSLFARQHRFSVAVFGAGLEHIATGLITEIILGHDSPFDVLGMSPGTDGSGGGITMRLDPRTTFNMITLYQKTAAERRRQTDDTVPALHSRDGQLRESERRVCAGVDAFIMVVDAARLGDSACHAHLERCRRELQLFMNPAWTKQTAPLVVWNCSSSATPRKASAVQTAELLRLPAQPRMWRVEDVCVENFAGPIARTLAWIARCPST